MTHPSSSSVALYRGNNYAYDCNGQMTQRGTQTLTWNTLNQLATAGTASFAYTIDGRR